LIQAKLFQNSKYYEITEENIISLACLDIILFKVKDYSNLTMNDVIGNFKWAGSDDKYIYQDICENKVTSSIIKENLANMNLPDEDERLQFTMKYLNYLRNILKSPNCFSEANRRLIINIFILMAFSPSKNDTSINEILLDVEHCLENPENIARVGNGPLDYFCSSLQEDVVMVTTIPVNHSSNDDNDSEEDINNVQDVQDGNNNVQDVQDGNKIKKVNILEAKQEVSEAALAQIFGQMKDELSLLGSRKRSFEESSSPNSIIERKAKVTGILSTGHHYMCFSLTSNDNSLPILDFYGDFVVNILPKRNDSRLTGLNNNDQISQSEVLNILKVMHKLIRL
jgi:hypothetical protein